ncbi:MAG: hypothetical protein HYX27_19670 [Acidobacteria bacterium]|nr:hypothetical protein [Acidobacteriota bacterium]
MEEQKKSKADIARENGAKSKGPVTPEGKARSSRNALKTGEHAVKLDLFVPPHAAVLCNEDRKAWADLIEELLAVYVPVNSVAVSIVKSIAVARWEISRLRACITMHWNIALVDQAGKPCPLVPELAEVYGMAQASAHLYAAHGPVRQLNRQIAELDRHIIRLERRLKFVHANFPNSDVEKRTDAPQPAAEETKELTSESPEKSDGNEPPIYINENKPSVISAYKSLFPGRKIVIVPPDDVARGKDIEDDMPIAPRKVA